MSILLKGGQLVNIFSDLLVLGFQMKDARDLGSIESLRARLEEMFQEADRRGVELGISRDTLMDARFAVVAFIDEMILNSGWAHKQEWTSRPLQYQYFETNVAGEEFFDRLNSYRKALPTNPDLLEVYLVCLVWGLEGKYKLQGREKLKDLINDVFREIEGRRGEHPAFSPHAERREQVLDLVKRGVPAWVIGVCSASIVFFFYIALTVLIHHEGTTVVQSLQELAERAIP